MKQTFREFLNEKMDDKKAYQMHFDEVDKGWKADKESD